ncbi:hypothetical protein [Hymenobacter terricola]|nr:hypothetical protein [Hymenobacter terricola]
MENSRFRGRRVVRHGIGWALVLSFFVFLVQQSGTGQVRSSACAIPRPC